MARKTNKDKETPDPIIDEVLNEEIPNEDEASDPVEVTDIPEDEILPDPENEETPEEKKSEDTEVEDLEEEAETLPEKKNEETEEQKDQRYKAQQAEAQIQNERNRALTDKVEEAASIPSPTIDQLKDFVKQDGVDWEELTTFEQATARRTYIAEKRFALVNDAVQTARKVDEWAKQVDTFIDSTDGKPEYVDLSSHEADFRKYAMKESHRGAPIDVLLGAFLHQLPKAPPKRGSLFEKGSGGDKQEAPKSGLTDADQVSQLRKNNPREYRRLVRAGKIKLET